MILYVHVYRICDHYKAFRMPYKYKREIDIITAMYSKLSDLPIELMRPTLKTVSTQVYMGTTQAAKKL